MKSSEIRSLFLDYFVNNGHELVKSSPLIPKDDPSLLFTNAGMVQFKKKFSSEKNKGLTVELQPVRNVCVQVESTVTLKMLDSLQDIILFFEMLGNFSFGDYFKREAIFFLPGNF